MSEDDRWSDVVEQVLGALDNADIADTNTRDALAEGVRQALESLESGVGLDVQILGEGFPFQDPEPVSVEIVEGGRSQEEPRSEGETPDLRIAEREGNIEKGTKTSPDETLDNPSIFTHVKVVRGNQSPPRQRVLPGLAEAGWIHVAGGDSPDSAWQTLYKGPTSRLYRVACSQGTLDVTADGQSIERLRPGQSIDVEAQLIRVTTSNDTEAIGGYTPIHPPTGEEE